MKLTYKQCEIIEALGITRKVFYAILSRRRPDMIGTKRAPRRLYTQPEFQEIKNIFGFHPPSLPDKTA